MRIGKYEMGQTLGEGHFGKVRLARHAETGRAFAIKILDRQRILAMKIDEQIKREIATLKLLKHPHVVRLYEMLKKGMDGQFGQLIYLILTHHRRHRLLHHHRSPGLPSALRSDSPSQPQDRSPVGVLLLLGSQCSHEPPLPSTATTRRGRSRFSDHIARLWFCISHPRIHLPLVEDSIRILLTSPCDALHAI